MTPATTTASNSGGHISSNRRGRLSQDHNNLMSQALKRVVKSDFSPGHCSEYLPQDCIDELVTRNAIIQELNLNDANLPEADEKLVKWILTEAPKLFLIVIDSLVPKTPIDKLVSMEWFQKYGLDDGRLPWTESSSFPAITPKGEELDESDQKWFQSTWSSETMNAYFKRSQWKFLVPVICSTKFTYTLQPEQILPLTLVSEETKEGAFGRVYRVQIHRSHIDHSVEQVALKEITTGGQKKAVEEAWPNEVRVLKKIKSLGNPHLIHCIAAFERGNGRYLLFPWAQGGNLREYWEESPYKVPNRDVVEDALVQLEGLAGALRQLHYFGLPDDLEDLPHHLADDILHEYDQDGANISIRHGDLKPENLLWFSEVSGKASETRRLRIADMGLAKRHVVATQDRSCLTSTRFGTILYEAPEAQTAVGNQPRSRQYDIWSMGCITLEWVIWILYGNVQLQRFYEHLKGHTKDFTPYYTLDVTVYPKKATLCPSVLHWISYIRATHPECQRDSAIKDLLDLVEERLLVVPLPPRRPTTLSDHKSQGPRSSLPDTQDGTVRYRATSKEFENTMKRMRKKVVESADYLLTSTGLAPSNPPPDMKPMLHPNIALRSGKDAGTGKSKAHKGGLVPPTTTARNNYSLPLLENWQFPVDNKFAQELVFDIGRDASSPPSSTPRLCDRCRNLDFCNPGFDIEESSDKLRQSSESCELCLLLWKAWSEVSKPEGPGAVVRFERTGSIVKMTGIQSLPVLSIVRSLDGPSSASEIQIGLPQLLQPRSEQFFQIIRKWLHDCDKNHMGCRFEGYSRPPTRLIDLGSQKSPTLRLVETANGVAGDRRYIALSHRWGDIKKHPPFCTKLKDTSGQGHDLESFKELIPYADVPQTFRDAIEATRLLGVRYLWIDSLCIIQGDGGDFGTEAKRMEEVFSGAYCVIAASRASNQLQGFLRERQQRQFVTIQKDKAPPLYICEAIDDFGRHVLDGALNRRGWVLQERALARRTVYFADAQTYFECGEGVRCETLSKMQNNMADLLGDARFPDKAMRTESRGLKIRYFQDLYRRYSQLEFSHIQDRPVAIAGLENRLRKAFWTKGGYGIFDDGPGHGLFHRSLLWQRSEDEQTLELIDFSKQREYAMPTWSWMAFKGGIDYLDPPFKKVDWEKTEVGPPWTRTSGGSDDSHSSRHLQVVVRSFNVAGYQPGEIKLVYDNPERKATSDGQRPMCVVVARSKEGKSVHEKRHYVLVVISTSSMTSQGQKVFTRLGVGYMPGRYIGQGEDGQVAVVG